MSVKKELFGETRNGQKVMSYILDNGTISFRVIDFGANLVNISVPDKNGKKRDVVLGWDDVAGYETNKDFLGALVGPSANRIAGAAFTIDGQEYKVPVNDGPNNLHTDAHHGVHKKMWKTLYGEDFVVFLVHLADGECGFPGNRDISVTYSITDDNAVKIHYHATSDKKTIFNMTNHSYFNLDGHNAGSCLDELLQVNASHFLPVRPGAIPTGEIRSVEGTVFDFRTPKTIGKDTGADDEQIRLVNGFDHNYVIDGYTGEGELLEAAVLKSEKSGIKLEVFTTLPGIQVYPGNFLDDENAKAGANYKARDGVALETQFYPDSIHHENFPSCVFGGNEVFDSTTKFRFGIC